MEEIERIIGKDYVITESTSCIDFNEIRKAPLLAFYYEGQYTLMEFEV